MPAWIITAMRLLGFIGLAAGATEVAQIVGGALQVSPGGFVPGFPDPGDLFTGGHAMKKRRRRRRALTASDRADIGFIVGLLGPGAGKNFAVTLAARGR